MMNVRENDECLMKNRLKWALNIQHFLRTEQKNTIQARLQNCESANLRIYEKSEYKRVIRSFVDSQIRSIRLFVDAPFLF